MLEVLFEGDRAVGVRVQEEDGARTRGAGQGGRRRQRPEHDAQNRLRAARVGPGAEEGGHLDLLGGRLPRHRPGRGGHAGHADARTSRAGSGTSRSTTTSSASAWWRRSTTCSRTAAQGPRGDLHRGSRALPRRQAARSPGADAGRLFATKDYSYRSKQAAGDGWVLVGDAFGFLDPLYSSGVLLALKSGELAADAIAEGLAKGDTSAAQLGKWEPDVQRGHGPHAPAGVRVLRRLQLRPVRQTLPALQGPSSPTC